MDRRSRAGEVVDLIDLDEERKKDVVTQNLKMRVQEQACDIITRPGIKIIGANDIAPLARSLAQR